MLSAEQMMGYMYAYSSYIHVSLPGIECLSIPVPAVTWPSLSHANRHVSRRPSYVIVYEVMVVVHGRQTIGYVAIVAVGVAICVATAHGIVSFR